MSVENKGTTSESLAGAESPLPVAGAGREATVPNQKEISLLSQSATPSISKKMRTERLSRFEREYRF